MNGFEVIEFLDISLQLILITGEVEIGLTSVKEDSIDAWYLDGFAPSKNPQMWTNELCQTISKLSADGASFSSFTAAGVVRRSLTQNGFIVKKIPGFQHFTIFTFRTPRVAKKKNVFCDYVFFKTMSWG